MDRCILPLFASTLYCTQIDISSAPAWNTMTWRWDQTRELTADHILDNVEWHVIRGQIQSHIDKFFYEELQAYKDNNIRITTSLANKSNFGQYHHVHTHANSILSGCLYFDFHNAGIKFIKKEYEQVQWPKNNNNMSNSQSWTIKPEPGLLLIWPSSLAHEVELLKKEDATRYSLAFNTWIDIKE
jgi:uncharacterized protein (TIGR02466 family)